MEDYKVGGEGVMQLVKGLVETYSNAAATGMIGLTGEEVVVLTPEQVDILLFSKDLIDRMRTEQNPDQIGRHILSLGGAMIELLRCMDYTVPPVFISLTEDELYFGSPVGKAAVPLVQLSKFKSEGAKKWPSSKTSFSPTIKPPGFYNK